MEVESALSSGTELFFLESNPIFRAGRAVHIRGLHGFVDGGPSVLDSLWQRTFGIGIRGLRRRPKVAEIAISRLALHFDL